MYDLRDCVMCPRECHADRTKGAGYCGGGVAVRVAKLMLHRWEEPCICNNGASGAVFFKGCSLGCVYCQNKDISRAQTGREASPEELCGFMLDLQDRGALNINLVTPTHYTAQIIEALDMARGRLYIPVIWNTGGYEKAETIFSLAGYVDVFLTDFKYGTRETAMKYSAAPDYPSVAAAALAAMYKITGEPEYAPDGLMKKGIILRHLVLPGGRHDSKTALGIAAAAVDPSSVVLSLMRQYTPGFAPESFPELGRRITTFEYNYVHDEALRLGYNGYTQEPQSAMAEFVPDFEV